MDSRLFALAMRMIGMLVAVLSASELLAGYGNTTTLTGHDLQVEVDSRWAGCGDGGYCPIRVRVINRGPTRTLTFRVARSHDPFPNVKQTLEVPQNGTRNFAISVPMVSWTTYGQFLVEDRNGPLENMVTSLYFPDINFAEPGRAGCVVVSPSLIDMQAFENGLATYRQLNGMTAHSGMGHRVSSGTNNTVVLPDSSLPAGWVDYCGIDMVILPAESLSKVRQDVRTALSQWTRCGGTLVVTNLRGASTDRGAVLKQLLGMTPPASTVWTEARISDRNEVRTVVEIDTGGSVRATSPPPPGVPNQWPLDTPPFEITEIGLGKLVVCRNDPLPGSIQDWAWFFKAVGGASQWDFGHRMGHNARIGNDDFLMFLIPGISGVPVVMFIVLITLFSIAIGPVNYFVLARRKKLHLLLLTIPSLAIVTSLLLFSYSVVAHGFSVKARSRSLTLIDQNAQSAVTMSRLSLYAGQAPSAGLKFSRDTAVLPVWPEHAAFESGQVDWTDSQVLSSGWLRSRTRTQFLTLSHRAERGRLEVKPQASDKLSVANGFEWGFEKLAVVDETGKLFIGEKIPAGAKIELKPASESEIQSLNTALQQYPLELPAGLTSAGASSWGIMSGPRRPHYYRHGRHYGGTAGGQWHFHQGRMETIWQRLVLQKNVRLGGLLNTAATANGDGPVPRTFFGLAAQNPGVELGVAKATEIASAHVVLGHW